MSIDASNARLMIPEPTKIQPANDKLVGRAKEFRPGPAVFEDSATGGAMGGPTDPADLEDGEPNHQATLVGSAKDGGRTNLRSSTNQRPYRTAAHNRRLRSQSKPSKRRMRRLDCQNIGQAKFTASAPQWFKVSTFILQVFLLRLFFFLARIIDSSVSSSA